MGYANDQLGDYRATRDTFGGKSGATISDALYTTYRTRVPGFRTGDWIKVQVAAPPVTVPSFLAPLLPKPAATQPTSTLPVYTAPPPRVIPPPPSPPSSPQTPTGAQAAAPMVAAAAAPMVGPIAATVPAVIDAATQPSPTRIRIVPDGSPAVSLSPAPSSDTGGGTSVDTSLPSTDQASVTGGSSPLDMLKNLPPLALAGLAGLALFFLTPKPRRR